MERLLTGHFDQTTADGLSCHTQSNITTDIGPIQRGRRSSTSLAIHDISGIPGSPMDRVGEFGSWWAPRGGTQTFPPPYLAGYSEFERTRRRYGSAGISRSAIEATPASQATSPTWSRRRCKGHVLPDLAGGRYHLAELITRDTP